LLLLIVGLFDIGRAVWLSNTLATAVREGSRCGVVHGALSGSPTWPDGNANRGSRIVVSASFPFTPILSQVFLGSGLGITLRSSSTLVIEQ